MLQINQGPGKRQSGTEPVFAGFPNFSLQALGGSIAAALTGKPEQSGELYMVTGWCDCSCLSILKSHSSLQFDSSGGILMHSLLPSLYHLKLMGERLDEPVATWYFRHILTMSWSWNQRTASCREHFHGRCLRSFFHRFQNNSSHLRRIAWKTLPRTLTLHFEPPWVEWWKGLTGQEDRESWRHFQIPGVPSAPQCWPLTLEVYQHVH